MLAFIAAAALQTQGRQMPVHVRSADSPLAIKVRLNGDLVSYVGTTPVMEGSRILVPLRGLFERMGITLSWDPANRIVTALGQGKTIVLPLGQVNAKVNGQVVTLDQPAMIIDNATFVPLRFISESLGAKVDWLDAERIVDIRTRRALPPEAELTQFDSHLQCPSA
jgi:hypothetical protein